MTETDASSETVNEHNCVAIAATSCTDPRTTSDAGATFRERAAAVVMSPFAKHMLQVIISSRQALDVITVKQPRPITVANLEKMLNVIS